MKNLKIATRPSGAASRLTIIVLGIVAILGVGLLKFYSNLVHMEGDIVAVHEDLKNVHTSIFNQMKSQGLTVEKYGKMVVEAMEVSVEGRYGSDGSRAVVQVIREQNPNIDPKIMATLQVAIESGYKGFESRQRTKIDAIRVYQNALRTPLLGWVAQTFLGFPDRVTDDMLKTVSSAATDDMMARKQMDTIDPFSKPAEAK